MVYLMKFISYSYVCHNCSPRRAVANCAQCKILKLTGVFPQFLTFGKTGTISSSGMTSDRSNLLMFMSAPSFEVSHSSTDTVLQFL